jgi:Sortase domain
VCATGAVHTDIFRSIRYLPNLVPKQESKIRIRYSGTPQQAGDSTMERGGRWHKFSSVAPRSRTGGKARPCLGCPAMWRWAHRDTFFRRLGELHRGDVIQVTVPGSNTTTKSFSTASSAPIETWDLQPATGQTLTLITCYPFHFVGSSPERFVVRARRSDTE